MRGNLGTWPARIRHGAIAMLNEQQLGFFARNGFLRVERLVDPRTCARLVDHTWTRLPPDWRRDDPSTWNDGQHLDSCHVADLRVRRGLFQFQKGDLLGNPVIEGAFGAVAGAPGGRLAQALIGHPLAKMRVRGLYCIAPVSDSIQYKTGYAKPHIESHAAQLVASCYLEDVAADGGALHVWPGSHREIYPLMGSKLEHVVTPAYDQVFTRWARRDPVAVPGRRGDVVIIHHRLLHAPNLNRSPRIRYAFFCDYQRDDFRRLSAETPSADVWEDWPAIARLPAAVRDGPPDYRLQEHRGTTDLVPLHSAQLSRAHTRDTDVSSIRKADASALARSRRAGDTWFALSDAEVTAADRELYPCGSDLESAGVSVRIDGKPLSSACRYDIFARLDLAPGEHSIEVEGLDRAAWLRVLRIRLPFIHTEFLLQRRLEPGRARIRFEVPGRPAVRA
jgi:hypothetical protein